MAIETDFMEAANRAMAIAEDRISTAQLLYAQAKQVRNEAALSAAIEAAGFAGQSKGLFAEAIELGIDHEAAPKAILDGKALLNTCDMNLTDAMTALSGTTLRTLNPEVPN
jgi:hypothetical protein